MFKVKMRVYVAGPYSRPDQCANTHRAVEMGNRLLEAGYAPLVPHLTHLWHTMTPRSYEDWLDYDLQFLLTCHALLRLPGESSGADAEVKFAEEHYIPVFHCLADLRSCFPEPILGEV